MATISRVLANDRTELLKASELLNFDDSLNADDFMSHNFENSNLDGKN